MTDPESLGAASATTRPRRSRVRLVVGIVSTVLVLCLGAGALTAYLVFRVARGPVQAVDDWFEAGRAGDVDTLRGSTCATARADVDHGGLEGETTAAVGWTVTRFNIVGDRATVTAEVRHDGSGQPRDETYQFTLVKEDGEWKVCGLVR